MVTAAGILNIIAGVGQLIGGLAIAIAGSFGGVFFGMPWLGALGFPLIALGIVALVGGIYALKRQMWGLALAGSICVIVAGNLLFGILSLVFIVTGKGEFE